MYSSFVSLMCVCYNPELSSVSLSRINTLCVYISTAPVHVQVCESDWARSACRPTAQHVSDTGLSVSSLTPCALHLDLLCRHKIGLISRAKSHTCMLVTKSLLVTSCAMFSITDLKRGEEKTSKGAKRCVDVRRQGFDGFFIGHFRFPIATKCIPNL